MTLALSLLFARHRADLARHSSALRIVSCVAFVREKGYTSAFWVIGDACQRLKATYLRSTWCRATHYATAVCSPLVCCLGGMDPGWRTDRPGLL